MSGTITKQEEPGSHGTSGKTRQDQTQEGFVIGRVVAEHKERYIVSTSAEEYEAEIMGNLRYTAKNREDFPAVGDWVGLATYDHNFAIIHHVLPRSSLIKRQIAGKQTDIQVIAANVDTAFIMVAADRDFSLNRIERYLTICNESRVIPVILIGKADLAEDFKIAEMEAGILQRMGNIQVISVSNQTQEGYEEINRMIQEGKTYCMLGSSGVGKSTLLNNLSGKAIMKTGSVSGSTHKGKHVTSHRELVLLPGGGFLIDNPGMREIGMTDTGDGLEITFDRINSLAQSCRFANCTHINETGCSVLKALENGELDGATYENYCKLRREKEYFETTIAEKRREEKIFSKMVKSYYKKDIRGKRDKN
jgi:ribosome biogenesis GTPase